MKTTMTLLAVLFAVSSLMAQSGPGQSSGANKRHSKNPRSPCRVVSALTKVTMS